jgi:hypothetical protein
MQLQVHPELLVSRSDIRKTQTEKKPQHVEKQQLITSNDGGVWFLICFIGLGLVVLWCIIGLPLYLYRGSRRNNSLQMRRAREKYHNNNNDDAQTVDERRKTSTVKQRIFATHDFTS